MKCEAIHELLTQYLLGDLPPNVSDELRAHLQDCDGCRAEASEIESTLDLLRDALASTSEVPASLEDSHYSKIYSAGESDSEESSVRKPAIIQIGSWFTTYHHQLAAAVAMICIGGVLLGVGMVQFGGMSAKSLMSVDSYQIPNGSGTAAPEVRIEEIQPMEEVELIEEAVASDKTGDDLRSQGPESKSSFIFQIPDLDDSEWEGLGDAEQVQHAANARAGRAGYGQKIKAGKMGKGGKKEERMEFSGGDEAQDPFATGDVDFEEIDSSFTTVAGTDGSSPVVAQVEEASKLTYSLVAAKPKESKREAEGSISGWPAGLQRNDAPAAAPERNGKARWFSKLRPTKKKRMLLERELTSATELNIPAPVAPADEAVYYRDSQAPGAVAEPSPPPEFSPKPAAFDSVPSVKSPLQMQGIYGSRMSAPRTRAVKSSGGGGAARDGADDIVKSISLEDADGDYAEGLDATVSPDSGTLGLSGKVDNRVNAEQYLISSGSMTMAGRKSLEAASVAKLGGNYKDMVLEKGRSKRGSEDTRKLDSIAIGGVVNNGLSVGDYKYEGEKEKGDKWKNQAKLRLDVVNDGKDRNEEVLYRNLPTFDESDEKSNASVTPKPEPEPQQPPSDPDEDLTGPKFKAFGVNPFVTAKDNAFSTFAIDVDTASYTLGRNYMLKGFLPPAESVRTEEFVNFFDYGYAAPVKGTFKIYTECAPSKFGHGKHMLKIGVKGRAIGREEQETAMLTFVIDSSGSMNQMDRMGLVKKSVALLLDKLTPEDEIAIVQFGSKARLVLEHTSASEKKKILDAVNSLQTSGSTNLEEAMLLAYKVAAKEFKPGASNRVLIMSDGAANIGEGAAQDILSKVKKYSKQGIFCSVFGFGIGTYNDEMLETLANKGNGTYSFIDSEAEAKRIFVDELSATLNTIASDVKIQVEFMPRFIKQYRQLGYENRQLTKKQFRDNTVDAGEVGSGQSVTALYEMEMSSRPELYADLIQCMAIVRVRYRRIDTGAVEEIEKIVSMKDMASSFDKASPKFKLAAGVAEFAEILRGSKYAAGSEFNRVAEVLRPIALEFNLDKRIRELTGMVQNAGGMSRGE